jgi:hypothetical protein
MEEIEVPLENVQEEIHHRATHPHDEDGAGNWFSAVALSSAVLAVLAAITALLASHHADEAMIEQIRASDNWAFFQAKGIKAAILSTKLDLLSSTGKFSPEADQTKLSEYKKEQETISDQARELEKSSQSHMEHHLVLARGVTFFQIAIAVAAISVLTRRRRFWLVALAFGATGLGFLVQGIFV